jgi:hypothetical protein
MVMLASYSDAENPDIDTTPLSSSSSSTFIIIIIIIIMLNTSV